MSPNQNLLIMKQSFLLFSAAICLLTACNNNKNPGITIKSEDGKTTTTVQASDLTQAADAAQKKAQELQKLSPYTLDQMKAMLPEELMGAKRSKFSANSAMGVAVAQGEYPINDSTEIELNVYDCAGSAGIGFYQAQFLTLMNFQSESDNEYSKTIEFKGGKALERHNKSSNRSTLTYISGDRLMVTLEGRNTGVDMLKQVANSLNLK
jgi:hypothetical protein